MNPSEWDVVLREAAANVTRLTAERDQALQAVTDLEGSLRRIIDADSATMRELGVDLREARITIAVLRDRQTRALDASRRGALDAVEHILRGEQ